MTTEIQPGSRILSPLEARMLYDAARLGELRARHRVGNTRLYQLLTELTICAFTEPIAATGNEPRQSKASEERDWWTVQQVARSAGLSNRTVRLDCQRQTLPAEKSGNTWTITRTAATTYINARTRT